MAKKIIIPKKSTGDTFSADELNQIVSVVNDNSDTQLTKDTTISAVGKMYSTITSDSRSARLSVLPKNRVNGFELTYLLDDVGGRRRAVRETFSHSVPMPTWDDQTWADDANWVSMDTSSFVSKFYVDNLNKGLSDKVEVVDKVNLPDLYRLPTDARDAIPVALRKRGLMISYLWGNDIASAKFVTETFIIDDISKWLQQGSDKTWLNYEEDILAAKDSVGRLHLGNQATRVDARKSVPGSYRKMGLELTYIIMVHNRPVIVNEQSNTSRIDDQTWADDASWNNLAIDLSDYVSYNELNNAMDALKQSITGNSTNTISGIEKAMVALDEKSTKGDDNILSTLDTKVKDAVSLQVAKGNILSDEERQSNTLRVNGTDYPIFTRVLIVNKIDGRVDRTTDIPLGPEPLGYNMFFEVASITTTQDTKSLTNTILNPGFKHTLSVTPEGSTLSLTPIQDQGVPMLKCTLVLNYVKFYGDIVTINLKAQAGKEDKVGSKVTVSIPPLKYNKKTAGAITVDDSASIWNGIFANCNKKWVDDELMSFFDPKDTRRFANHMKWEYNGYTKTTGYTPSRFMDYSSGTGFKRRFAADVAIIPSWTVPRDVTGGPMLPWVASAEMRYMQDFGYTFSSHDIEGNTDQTPQAEWNKLVDATYNKFLGLFDRRPKINQNPNGDMIMLGKSWGCPYMQYTMDAQRTRKPGDNSGYYYPFRMDFDISDKSLKYIIERQFQTDEITPAYWADKIIKMATLPERDREFVIIGTHGASKDYFTAAFNKLTDKVGSAGADTVWIPSINEFFEYMYIRDHSLITVKSDAQKGTIDISILMPKQDNFWFRDASLLVNNLDSSYMDIVGYSSNVVGISKGNSDGSLLINFDVNQDLPIKAEKYTALAESTKDIGDYEDAQYFVNQLRVGLKEPLQARLDRYFGAPTLNNVNLSYDNSYYGNNSIVVIMDTTGSNPSEMSIKRLPTDADNWIPFSQSYIIALTDKELFASSTVNVSMVVKVRNSLGESHELIKSLDITPAILTLGNCSLTDGEVVSSRDVVVQFQDNARGHNVYATISEVGGESKDYAITSEASIGSLISRKYPLRLSSTPGIKTIKVTIKDNSRVEPPKSTTFTVTLNIAPLSLSGLLLDGNADTVNVLDKSSHDITFKYTGSPTHYYLYKVSGATPNPLPWTPFPPGSLNITFNVDPLTLPDSDNQTWGFAIKDDTTILPTQHKSIRVDKPMIVSDYGFVEGSDTYQTTFNTTLTFNRGEVPLKYRISGDITSAVGYTNLVMTDNKAPITGTISAALGTKTFTIEIVGSLGTVVTKTHILKLIEKPTIGRKVIFSNVLAHGDVNNSDPTQKIGYADYPGVGKVNSQRHDSARIVPIVDTEGNKFCDHCGNYTPYLGDKFKPFIDKYGINAPGTFNPLYWPMPKLTDFATPSIYDAVIVNPSDKYNRNILIFYKKANEQLIPEKDSAGNMLMNVPAGNYKIRLLPCSCANDGEYTKAIYRVQDTKIPGTINPYMNNQNWYEVDTKVDADGYLYIGYYGQGDGTSDMNLVSAPPAVIEIIRTA